MTLTPAYGRDYKSQKAVKEAWAQDKDFEVADIFHPECGRMVNRPQLKGETGVYIRYSSLRKIVKVQ